MTNVLKLIVAFAMVCASTAAVGSLITYDLGGTAAGSGAPLLARLIVNTDTPDALGGLGGNSTVYTGAIVGGTVMFNGMLASIDVTDMAADYIQIINDVDAGNGLLADDLQLHASLSGGAGPFLASFSSIFPTVSGGPLASALLIGGLPLGSTFALQTIVAFGTAFDNVEGPTIAPNGVPEPSSAWLALAGALAMGAVRLRRLAAGHRSSYQPA